MYQCQKCGFFYYTIHTPNGIGIRHCRCHQKKEDKVLGIPLDMTRHLEILRGAMQGVKHDQDKPHMNLLFQEVPNALVEVSKALRMGELKYGRENWKKVDNLEDRYLAALLRHLVAIQMGEKQDKESGLSHLAHVAVNAMFLLDYEASK